MPAGDRQGIEAMLRYFVTRHQGAIEWARRRGIAAKVVPHLDARLIETLGPGVEVLGTLPVQLVAEVTRRGATYRHLEIEVPQGRRGGELTADEMEAYGACLVGYRAERIEPPTPAS